MAQIVHQTDEPLQIFLVLWGRHLAYVFYFVRVCPDSILAIHIPEEYDLAGLDVVPVAVWPFLTRFNKI